LKLTTVGPDEEFARLLGEGRLAAQQCGECQFSVFPPRVLCPRCGSDAMRFRALGGLGTVYSTTVVRARAADGGPYNLALIDLDEGIRMMSRIEGIDPAAVSIGMRVRARIAADGSGGSPLVVFDPS
jgi:uncharacterized protein